MYHTNYPTSWMVGNQFQYKSPFLLTYGDLPLLSVDHITSFTPYTQLSSVYASPITFDVPNMKRIPISLLMQGVESVNCYIPAWRRKDYSWSPPERQFSKESISDSGASGDSGLSSSRSSTPSSIGTSGCEDRHNPKNDLKGTKSPGKKQRKHSTIHATTPGRSLPQKHYGAYSQRHYTGFPLAPKGFSPDYPTSQPPPHHLLNGDEWSEVTRGIWKHFVENRQREEVYMQKMKLRDAVYAILQQVFPYCSLHVVGSSVNGLGTNTSDMDMCLMLSMAEIDQQTEAMHILKYAQMIFSRCSFVKSTDLITAKVPILKFTDKYNGVQVDLNINNAVGIWNTRLIKNYCRLDWRVQPLVLVIKKWAQDCDINNAKEMTLSSYSLVLMIIHFLQCGSFPPVLPCLQRMRPKKFLPDIDEKWKESQDDLPKYKSRNTEPLGELLLGFFDYFSNCFNFERDVMSVRLGCKLSKHVAMSYRSSKNKRGHWKYICIEEPFHRTNTACAVYDEASFSRILAAFKSSWSKLKADKEINAILRL